MFMLVNYYRMNRPPPKKKGLGRQISIKMQATGHKNKERCTIDTTLAIAGMKTRTR